MNDYQLRDDVNARNDNGFIPLMGTAAVTLSPEIVSTLIEAGANINARNADGWTPLMITAMYDPSPNVVTVLLKAGADFPTFVDLLNAIG